MTDITELAQSLKAAAEKATQGLWEVQFGEEIYATDGVDNEQVAIATLDARDADYIALANPANILALVEALEKAQKRIVELSEGKVGNTLLERENHHVELVGKLAERIAELESRTVKLPPCVDDLHGIGMAMPADAVIEMLAAAGIKVEAE